MADYKTSVTLYGAYNFDADALKSIFNECKAFLAKDPAITLTFSQGHSLDSTEITEVLSDFLTSTQFITGVTIDGANYKVEPARSCSIYLRSSEIIETCSINIVGDQDRCKSLRIQLEELLNVKRQWYSFLYPRNIFLIVLMAMIAIFVVLIISAFAMKLALISANLSTSVLTAMSLPVLVFLGVFRRVAFPQLTFEIGRSVTVRDRGLRTRQVLFGGVVLALVIGVVSSLIASAISK